MSPRLALILIALPTMALAADQTPPSGKFASPAPQSAAAPSPAPAPPFPPPAAPLASAVASVDPTECRVGCADAYYACSAGEREDACPSTWSRCVAECASPDLAAPSSAEP